MFSEMTNDELADAGKALFEEIEARIETLDNPSLKMLLREHVGRAHLRADKALKTAKAGNLIQPFSGGEPKPQ